MPAQPQNAPLPAVIYARISRDREGAGLGVERQEADCRALAERLGWSVVGVFVDNDVSAYSGRTRPQYRAMLDALERGSAQGVLAWHTDRLHRRASELEEFVTLVERQRVEVQTVTAGNIDLSTASGRLIARLLGATAQHEVDHARERMQRAKAQMAADGLYRGGRRPFGYEADGVTVREDEAQIVRDATAAVLAGRSLRALARELDERGSTTSWGKPWNYAALRDVLIRPRNAGLVARGRAGRSSESFQIVGPAQWPAIVDEDQWRAVLALLTDPSRRKQDGNDTRWLGSGIYVCGVDGCAGAMRAAPYGGTKSRKHERRHLYRCTTSAHLTISTGPTDAYVRQVVAELVRDPRIVAALAQDDDALAADRQRRAALAARLDAFERDYAEGIIDGAQLARASARVNAELAEVDERLSTGLRRSTSSGVLDAPDPGRAFLDAPIDVQRAVVAAVLRIEVLPAPVRGGAWTPERLRLHPIA